MAKNFRPSNRESVIISKIESSKEFARKKAIAGIRDCKEPLANALATKLIENSLIETTNKNMLEEQIEQCLDKLCSATGFDVDYQISPVRNVVSQPNIVSQYVTAFVIEQLINHKDVIDIFGTDKEIYYTIHKQITKYLPL